MRIIGIVLFILLIPLASGATETGMARISLIKGDLQIQSEETDEWAAAAINTPLEPGDRLWSPAEGRAEIQVRGGISVRIAGSTALDVMTVEEDALQFYLEEGRTYVNNRQGGIEHIQIDTPYTSISTYDNSIAMISVTEQGETDLSVIKGYAYAETRDGRVRIDAGTALRIYRDSSAETAPLSTPDPWERWNHKRDKKLAEPGDSLRYLPDELDTYAADLNSHGRWVYDNNYGYCWIPTVGISVDWSPYRLGRWVWRRGHYVWISQEPWGWAPYHYGRWAYRDRFGWCWVPPRRGAVYWGPGYVGWVATSTSMAWVPLAPGEVYYGYGHYGPDSVNITNVSISYTNVVYRNAHVGNAVTVVERKSFLGGERYRPIRTKENPFLEKRGREGASFAPPVSRPGRQGYLPSLKSISERSRPPEKIRTLKPDKVREGRRLRRSESDSGFKPPSPPAPLPVKERPTPRPLPPEATPRDGKRTIDRKPPESAPKPETRPPRREPLPKIEGQPPRKEPPPRIEGQPPRREPLPKAERVPKPGPEMQPPKRESPPRIDGQPPRREAPPKVEGQPLRREPLPKTERVPKPEPAMQPPKREPPPRIEGQPPRREPLPKAETETPGREPKPRPEGKKSTEKESQKPAATGGGSRGGREKAPEPDMGESGRPGGR